MKTAANLLREAAKTFEARNKVYGNNYLNVGGAMAALFPDGMIVKTAHDWNRLHIFLLGIVKLSRYAVNWNSGHQDSIHDAIVYAAILESLDLRPNSSPPRIPHLRRRPRKRLGHGR